MTIRDKKKALIDTIRRGGPMLVSFSGGVDSTLLAALAKEALGEKCHCVLLDSSVVPRAAVHQAVMLAADLGLALDVIAVPLLEDATFCSNPEDRCYHCKKISAGYLKRRANELGLACIADGVNVSDTKEHRPGLRASTEEGIIHPFIECGCTKQDIRDIAREMRLPVWQKPSAACLSSRIPYNDRITIEKLRIIENAEEFIAARGFSQFRVRLHGNIARIEVHKEDMGKILEEKDPVVEYLRTLGIAYVTLDLAGYRSGSMDEVLG
ncbi:MAG TPA: ATP-dependent sacrificial sulfur transferase LarE [Methanoregula sp.]|nr:ATP-dependent sacrificial sulfur transferase LarE [Methanoregula sp.]